MKHRTALIVVILVLAAALLIGACLLAILFLCLTLRKPAVQAAPQQAG